MRLPAARILNGPTWSVSAVRPCDSLSHARTIGGRRILLLRNFWSQQWHLYTAPDWGHNFRAVLRILLVRRLVALGHIGIINGRCERFSIPDRMILAPSPATRRAECED
jgi:hypothetical protein